MLKHKYSEQLNRRLSWDKHPFSEDSRHVLRRMMKSYWLSSYPGGSAGDETHHSRDVYADSKSGVRPGRNIEDVERGAIDHLIYGEDEEPMSASQCRNRNRKRRRMRQSKHTMESVFGQPAETEEYIIDPITNRKVAKQPSPSSSFGEDGDIPVKTFKDYRSQFSSPNSVSEHAGSVEQQAYPYLQSDKYYTSNEAPDAQRHASEVFESKPDELGVSQGTEKDASTSTADYRYDDLFRDRPLQGPGLDANLASSVEGLAGNPEGRSRKRILIDESHGKFDDLQPPPENTDDFRYKSMVADEIANKFEAVELRETDQSTPATAETDIVSKAAPIFEDSDQHLSDRQGGKQGGKPLGFKEEFVKPEVLRRYRASIEPVEPGDFSESTVENLRAKYGTAELKQFTTVRHAENGETSTLASDDGSCLMNEGEEMSVPSVEQPNDSQTHRDPPSSTSQDPESSVVSGMQHAQEVMDAQVGYQQRFKIEDDVDVPLSGSEILEKLVSVKQGHGRKPNNSQFEVSGDLEGGPVPTSEASSPLQPSLERLTSVRQGQGKQSNYREMLESLMSQHERMSDAQDDEAILAVQMAKAKNREIDAPQRKLTGNYMRDFPEEFEKSWTQTLSSMSVEAETSLEAEAQVANESMDGGLEGGFGRPSASKIQPALDRHNSSQATIDQDNHTAKESEIPEHSQSQQTNDLIQQGTIASDVKDETIPATEAKDSTPVVEVARDNAVEELRESFEESSPVSENEPVLYKILAYDPTMQKVNMAETTSLVPDFTSALSPADALLRLSHPTKFFPHFASLEAEGFEIASGSGDVLVFRKVRPSKPDQAEETPAETATTTSVEPSSGDSPVNPIDMTGRPRVASPASANFASPTGYVKYENLPETEASKLPPPPRVAYNINLRREEPVYSGPKQRVYGEQKQRKSVGHRLLLGGVWVAGISYGLGVVSEYFTTGGMDGLGPQGL